MAMSSRAGMGAVPYAGGVTFRVWAPFASAVSVAGSFNGWDAQVAPLAQEGNDYWSVDVAGAEAECCVSGACASTKAATHHDTMHNHAKREILRRWTTTVF